MNFFLKTHTPLHTHHNKKKRNTKVHFKKKKNTTTKKKEKQKEKKMSLFGLTRATTARDHITDNKRPQQNTQTKHMIHNPTQTFILYHNISYHFIPCHYVIPFPSCIVPSHIISHRIIYHITFHTHHHTI